MTIRATKKQESRKQILEAAAKRIRTEGINGAGIAAVMDDAGLTHGAFYSHFENKDELARAALVEALQNSRNGWTSKSTNTSWRERLAGLAKRYLTKAHRANLSNSCALATLCSEAARSDDAFKSTYESELIKTLTEVAEQDFDTLDEKQSQDVLAFMSLIVGSMVLSRAVKSRDLSDKLLIAGKNAANRIAD
ncbi:TetR/AcrR family transcriptional regulator [Marinobacter sediminum]|uniref:TetR/AcrR family transcriptional regulator n=1 Tax=Marinobacter sediminum TaxID=256323 RepID=UPI00202F3DD5|nr:TetR/AcrR family transcriptional regulator [Marinobacter sediminum]MCM0614211.1 TetR/AcrR family transcriptional regulator [Marinobacter sediminum]